MKTVIHDQDWWAYQLRVVAKKPTPFWDKRLVEFAERVLCLDEHDCVLDLCCGSGEHAIQLAIRDMNVIGVDISHSLIAHCEAEANIRKLGNASFLQKDMRELAFREMFDAVTVLGVSFGFYSDEVNQHVLDRIREALVPGGRLLLHLMDPATYLSTPRQGRTWKAASEGMYHYESYFDPARFVIHTGVSLLDNENVFHMQQDPEQLRLYTLPEIKAMLHETGFETREVYGDVLIPLTIYDENHHREMIVVAERPLSQD